jgi:hypothetical protein
MIVWQLVPITTKVVSSNPMHGEVYSIQHYVLKTLHTNKLVFMVFNATFNNTSVISWWSVLLVEETGVPRENHRPVSSH